jgi:glycosyltransferase involved in cell wall biosynthesis
VRLAWFTPWPPQASGVAGRSRELTDLLTKRGWGIDVCVDERRIPALSRHDDDPVEPGILRVQSAHDFVWRHARRQYNLVVYQVGNSKHHDFIWPYLFQWPGLVVLHDVRLHHARARRLLRPGGAASYRAEFAFDHPATPIDAAELAVSGFDGRYYAAWPMLRAVVESARAVGVHSRGGQAAVAEAFPGRAVSYLPLGEGSLAGVNDAERARTRRAYGAGDDSVVFGAFGGLSADKRVTEIVRASGQLRRRHANVRLWLAGTSALDVSLASLAEAHGVGEAVTHLGALDDAAFDQAIAAVDVSLNLRWPSAIETSGPWLRAMAMERPTISMELEHQAHVPALDPRDWRARNPADTRPPVTVSIDVLDEHHSLVLAMDRLAADAALRARLGGAAREYWLTEHTPGLMAEAYDRVLRDTIQRPLPHITLPASLRPDVWESTRGIAEECGLTQCELR